MPIRPPVASHQVEGLDRIAVVAVMVVDRPGDWFDETLDACVAQTYEPMNWLFLLSPVTDEAVEGERIRSHLPQAIVRPLVGGDGGFGSSANHVLELVEGDNGLFCLMHDDVAPAPRAIEVLVEEFHRSNAGLVGPKFVMWDDPRRLLDVGVGLDRFGEVNRPIELGELDQEQHDAVRDVFVLSSACLLVRADLFRTLGGFESSIDLIGENVDLCWRAHWLGARVVIAPDAVVRHRAALSSRHPEVDSGAVSARRRIDTVLSLTGPTRLLIRSMQLLLLTIVEAIVGLFTGRGAEAWHSVRALVTVPLRWRTIAGRRRRVGAIRVVDEAEVLGLQSGGSARLTDFLRSRDTEELVAGDTTVRRWRQRGFAVGLTWMFVVLGLVIGSRELLRGREPWAGRLLPVDDGVTGLISSWWSSWDPRGVGATTAAPGGWLVVGVLRFVALGDAGATLGLLSVGTVLLGLLGLSRVLTVFPTERARVAGLAVYAAAPLVPTLFRRGDVDALVVYAVIPWVMHLTRRLAGIATADASTVEGDLPDGLTLLRVGERRRLLAGIALVVAIGAAVAPVTMVVSTGAVVVMALSTVIVRARWSTAWRMLLALGGVGTAWLLLLPWSATWDAHVWFGPGFDGVAGNGLVRSVAFGDGRWVGLSVALYLTVFAAVMITRAWRLTWSVRGATLALSGLLLIVLADRGIGARVIPAREILLVPVLLGVSITAAGVIGGFGSDVLARVFSWRQPLVLAAQLGLVIGLVPGVISVGDGAWRMADDPIAELAASQFPPRSDLGSYRVLWVGDPRVLPLPSERYSDGIGFAVSDAGAMSIRDGFATADGAASTRIREVLNLLAEGSTSRIGRLLAPLGIRYVVVPLADGVDSTVANQLPTPVGLLDGLAAQLDVGAIQSPPTIEVFINRSWIPPAAFLSGAAAEASKRAGEDSLLIADLAGVSTIVDDSGGTIDLVDVVAARGPTLVSVPDAGVLHLGVPFDGSWRATLDGVELEARAGFGFTTAFDLPSGGQVLVEHDAPLGRTLVTLVVMLGWMFVAAALLRPGGRTTATSGRGAPVDGPLLTLPTHGHDEATA